MQECNAPQPNYLQLVLAYLMAVETSRSSRIMKTFLSVGTAPGMGLATAERFAKEGFRVILSARNAARTQELAN
jgi:NADP-dependent 3-hydroxy acid dehydrogenase YdfG